MCKEIKTSFNLNYKPLFNVKEMVNSAPRALKKVLEKSKFIAQFDIVRSSLT